MQLLHNTIKAIKEYLRSVPFATYETALTVIKVKDELIKKQDKEIMLLRRQVIALEKDIEFRVREKLIDQELIVQLLSYTDIPKRKLRSIEDKVSKQKEFIRKYYGKKHPDHKYNPASISLI